MLIDGVGFQEMIGANPFKYDKRGYGFQKNYAVAWSDGRNPDDNGKLQPVGNTVDISKATCTNDIGDTQLSAVWMDSDFDASQHTVYYARVIEIPAPRWTAYDAERFDVTMSNHVPMITTERAYTSPIWCTPRAK